MALIVINNRITSSGFSYDAAGNLLNDGPMAHSYQYDDENRIKSVDSGAANYYYNADGQRVKAPSRFLWK